MLMDDRVPLSLDRLRTLLEAYGADPERWPDAERAAARALLAHSPDARRWQAAHAQLDSLLDQTPVETAAPALVERIMSALPPPARAAHGSVRPAAPRREPDPTGRPARHRSRTWRYVAAAIPLVAAAAAVFWLRHVPTTVETTPIEVAELDAYELPTDALLDFPNAGAFDDTPAFGCTGDGLGCVEEDPLPNPQSALEMEKYV